MNNKIVEAVTNWILWTVRIASIPFILKVLLDFILQKNPIHINEELLLVSVIITGHSIGKGFESNVRRPLIMTVTIWFCLIIAITSTFLFAISSMLEKEIGSTLLLFYASLILALFAVISSSCCIAQTKT